MAQKTLAKFINFLTTQFKSTYKSTLTSSTPQPPLPSAESSTPAASSSPALIESSLPDASSSPTLVPSKLLMVMGPRVNYTTCTPIGQRPPLQTQQYGPLEYRV